MTETDTLQRLEAEINQAKIQYTPPLHCDQWLASSAWQKSIRRGHVDSALRAAATLWQSDRRSFWRRCQIVAAEDIGIGDIATTTDVLMACMSPKWRLEMNDLRVALYLTQRLCKATKSRLAEQVYTVSCHALELDAVKKSLATLSNEELAIQIGKNRLPVLHRVIALWLLAGTVRFPSEKMPFRRGCMEAALSTLEHLGAPPTLVQVCREAAPKTQYPLAMFLPLLASASGRSAKIKTSTLPEQLLEQGIPLYAADMFTRTGKSAIRDLISAIPDLKQFTTAQVGLGVFYIEGRMLDRELLSPRLQVLKDQAEIADFAGSGVCIPRFLGLKETLNTNWAILQSARRSRISSALESRQGNDLFSGDAL